MGSSPTIRIELNRKKAGNSRVSGFFFYSNSPYGTLVGQIVFYFLSKLSTVVPNTAASLISISASGTLSLVSQPATVERSTCS